MYQCPCIANSLIARFKMTCTSRTPLDALSGIDIKPW